LFNQKKKTKEQRERENFEKEKKTKIKQKQKTKQKTKTKTNTPPKKTNKKQCAEAKVNDTLIVEIMGVTIKRCWSVWESNAKCGGCLQAKRALFSGKGSIRELTINEKEQKVIVSDRLSVPLSPMIGCIATASHDPKNQSTFVPTYPTGGNMDLREASPGVTIHLPVEVEGGMLYIGDLHAAMGQGEPTWVGYEAAGTAVVRVSVSKKKGPPFPRLFTKKGEIIFTAVVYGKENSHDQALQDAVAQAYHYLIQEKGMTEEEAHGFITALGEGRFGGPASIQALLLLPDTKEYFSQS